MSISNKLDVVIETNEVESSGTYKLATFLNWNSNIQRDGLTFQNEMDIEIRETRKVPIHDTVYTLKVFRPVKNFSLHYSIEDAKPQINGTIFGILTNKNDGTIQVNQDSNSIT